MGGLGRHHCPIRLAEVVDSKTDGLTIRARRIQLVEEPSCLAPGLEHLLGDGMSAGHRADSPPSLGTPQTGRRVAGPIQGFGPMWQKTFAVRLEGVDITPEGLVAHWRERFPTFWPKGARFYSPLSGIQPGEVALLEVSSLPGSPVKMSTGIMVIYSDREAFTFMTPEGHALSAWITFSAFRDGDTTIAQAQALEAYG